MIKPPHPGDFIKVLEAKEKAKDEKLTWLEGETFQTYSQEMHEVLAEQKKQIEHLTMFYGGHSYSPGEVWWMTTNDPKTWGGHTHSPAVSASASWNYTQVFAAPYIVDAIKNYKAPMTREKAIALNNGEV